MAKIRIEDLTEESTPCEICMAMNGRAVEKREYGYSYSSHDCHTSINECLDSDKAMIKLLYWNYIQTRRG